MKHLLSIYEQHISTIYSHTHTLYLMQIQYATHNICNLLNMHSHTDLFSRIQI